MYAHICTCIHICLSERVAAECCTGRIFTYINVRNIYIYTCVCIYIYVHVSMDVPTEGSTGRLLKSLTRMLRPMSVDAEQCGTAKHKNKTNPRHRNTRP